MDSYMNDCKQALKVPFEKSGSVRLFAIALLD